MSSIETAVHCAKTIESLLESRFGASGRGLHEKASSVESHLPEDVVRKIRKIATLRNKTVHESGFTLKDVNEFSDLCNEVAQQLRALPPRVVMDGNEIFISEKEQIVYRFFERIHKPALMIVPLMLGGIAWLSTGIGAAIFWAILGAVAVELLTSKRAIALYINVFYFILGLSIILGTGMLIFALWHVGSPIR